MLKGQFRGGAVFIARRIAQILIVEVNLSKFSCSSTSRAMSKAPTTSIELRLTYYVGKLGKNI